MSPYRASGSGAGAAHTPSVLAPLVLQVLLRETRRSLLISKLHAVLITPLTGPLLPFGHAGATGLSLWARHAARLPLPWSGVDLEVRDSGSDVRASIHAALHDQPEVLFGPYGSHPMLVAARSCPRALWNHGGATSRLARPTFPRSLTSSHRLRPTLPASWRRCEPSMPGQVPLSSCIRPVRLVKMWQPGLPAALTLTFAVSAWRSSQAMLLKLRHSSPRQTCCWWSAALLTNWQWLLSCCSAPGVRRHSSAQGWRRYSLHWGSSVKGCLGRRNGSRRQLQNRMKDLTLHGS